MHARIAEAEGGGALTSCGGGWKLEPLEEGVGQALGLDDLLDLEQPRADVLADGPQLRQRVQALVGLKVFGVVDRRLGAQRLGFLEDASMVVKPDFGEVSGSQLAVEREPL